MFCFQWKRWQYFFLRVVGFFCFFSKKACDPVIVSSLIFFVWKKFFFSGKRKKESFFIDLVCCFCLRTKLYCLFDAFSRPFVFYRDSMYRKRLTKKIFFLPFFLHCWKRDRLCWPKQMLAGPFVYVESLKLFSALLLSTVLFLLRRTFSVLSCCWKKQTRRKTTYTLNFLLFSSMQRLEWRKYARKDLVVWLVVWKDGGQKHTKIKHRNVDLGKMVTRPYKWNYYGGQVFRLYSRLNKMTEMLEGHMRLPKRI